MPADPDETLNAVRWLTHAVLAMRNNLPAIADDLIEKAEECVHRAGEPTVPAGSSRGDHTGGNSDAREETTEPGDPRGVPR